jgi:hypothetical protein
MRDFALEIRMELFRVRPEFGVHRAEQAIQNVARCFQDITSDNAKCGHSEWHDFFDFLLDDGLAVVTIYRKTEVEIFVFAADNSLVRMAEHLAMVDVDEFLEKARSHFALPDSGLRFPLSQILPWLESSETG